MTRKPSRPKYKTCAVKESFNQVILRVYDQPNNEGLVYRIISLANWAVINIKTAKIAPSHGFHVTLLEESFDIDKSNYQDQTNKYKETGGIDCLLAFGQQRLFKTVSDQGYPESTTV